MSPVTSRWEVPAQSSPPRCRPRGDGAGPPRRLGRASPGSPAAAGHGWRWPGRPRSRSPATHTTPIRSANWGSTEAAPAFERGWVAWAILRAFHGATTNASTAAQIRGSRCQVQGVGQQLQPGQGGDPERGGERFGGERRHQRRPLPTQRLVCRVEARQAGVGPGHEPGLDGGRVQHAPLGREPGACCVRLAYSDLGVGGEVEHPLRVEVETSTGAPFTSFRSCVIQPAGTDNPTPKSRLKRGLWRSIFEAFLQPRLGCIGLVVWLRFRPTRCGCVGVRPCWAVGAPTLCDLPWVASIGR